MNVIEGVRDWVNGAGENAVNWGTEKATNLAMEPIKEMLTNGITYTITELTAIMPELAVAGLLITSTIGMFGNTGKWLARGAMVYMGGAVWILLF